MAIINYKIAIPYGYSLVNLGIGMSRGTYQSITREWLYWYNEDGKRLLTPEEQAKQAQQRAEILAERLRTLGVDPDSIA
jgi:hypothetical protein